MLLCHRPFTLGASLSPPFACGALINVLLQFDFCSRDRHFATTVVRASSTCETLLNAIFAVSAKHLSLSGNFDRLASDQYLRKCLQTLIPALKDQGSVLETTLFAATAILRLFDEMSGRHPRVLLPSSPSSRLHRYRRSSPESWPYPGHTHTSSRKRRDH